MTIAPRIIRLAATLALSVLAACFVSGCSGRPKAPKLPPPEYETAPATSSSAK